MRHLVYYNVLKTFRWFLGQIGIDPDVPGCRIAASTFSLHLLYKDTLHLHAQDRFPLRDQSRHRSLDLLSIPTRDDGALRFVIGSRTYSKNHRAALQFDSG